MRVYHVVDRSPYESVVVREVGDNRPIQIADEMLTAGLSSGDKIATRILTVNGQDYLADPILVLDNEPLAGFDQAFESTFKEAIHEAPKYLRNSPQHRNAVRKRLVKELGPVIAQLWVMSILAIFRGFQIDNEHDPDTWFPGTIPVDSKFEPLLQSLNSHPDLKQPIPQEFVPIWRTSREDSELTQVALIWPSGSDIILESGERSRVQEAAESLMGLLGDAVGELTIEELGADADEFDEVDEDEDESSEGDEPLVPMPMSGEEEEDYRQRLRNFPDHQFRSLLDSPIRELRDGIPRELTKTAKGRKRVSEWLRTVESKMRTDRNKFYLVDYDLGWMWKELGIEAHRQASLFP